MLRPFSTNVDIVFFFFHRTTLVCRRVVPVCTGRRGRGLHGFTREIIRLSCVCSRRIRTPGLRLQNALSDAHHAPVANAGQNVLIADGFFRYFFNERTKNHLRRTRHVGSARFLTLRRRIFSRHFPIFHVTATDCLWSLDVQRRLKKRRHAVPRCNDCSFLWCHTTRSSLSPNRRRVRMGSDSVRVRTTVFHLCI